MDNNNLTMVARIYSQFSEKFGIPRQSGLVKSLLAEIHFEGEFKNADAVRGIEDFSHLWLLWGFTRAQYKGAVTVAPPRLEGSEKREFLQPARHSDQIQSDFQALSLKRWNTRQTVNLCLLCPVQIY